MPIRMPKKTAAKKEVVVEKKEIVELPPPPKPEKGELVMRMIYTNGKHRDIVCENMVEAMSEAMSAAQDDGYDFTSAKQILSWERIA